MDPHHNNWWIEQTLIRNHLHRPPGIMNVPAVVTELNDNDVLMGRGAPSTEYSGNLNLRQLVLDRRREYLSCTKRVEKHKISREIIDAVHKRGGRFLHRVTTMEEAQRLNTPPGKQAWRVIPPSTPLFVKVKQLMRDVGVSVHSSLVSSSHGSLVPLRTLKQRAPSVPRYGSLAGSLRAKLPEYLQRLAPWQSFRGLQFPETRAQTHRHERLHPPPFVLQ